MHIASDFRLSSRNRPDFDFIYSSDELLGWSTIDSNVAATSNTYGEVEG
jgi:hypothetical protein